MITELCSLHNKYMYISLKTSEIQIIQTLDIHTVICLHLHMGDNVSMTSQNIDHFLQFL